MQKYGQRQTDKYSAAKAAAGVFFWSLITLLSCCSSVYMAQDIFPQWELSKRAWIWILGLAVFTIVLYELGISKLVHMHVFLGLSVPVIYAAVCVRYAKSCQIDLEDGACALAVQFLEKYNRHLGTSYSIWRGKTEFIGMALAFWLLAILLGLLILALLSAKRGILLLLPAAVFAAELTIGYVPQWNSMAYFFAALLFLQADGGAAGSRAGHAEKRKYAVLNERADGHRKVRWYVRWLPSVCLAGALALMLAASSWLSGATEPQLMRQAPKVMQFQRKTEQNAAEILRRFTVSKQESVTNQSPRYTGKEMLKVTASQKPLEDVLLKGFYGTDYRNGSWVCENRQFEEACTNAGYDIKEAETELLQAQYNAFEAGGGYTSASVFTGSIITEETLFDRGKLEYTIEHSGSKGRQAYLPYVTDYAQNSGRERLSGDVTMQRGWNQNAYTFQAWNYTIGDNSIVWQSDEPVSDVFEWYDEFVRSRYLDRYEGVPSMKEYMSQTIGAESILELLRFKEDYEWFTEAFQRNQLRMNLAQMISAYIRYYQSYSMDLTPLPEGEDPVYFFLMRSHEGYCVHFASAAVMLFREMGIPARYASGYAVRADDFVKEGDSYTASVKDSDAHAWAEIYLEELGWVPIDVTPGDRQRPDWLSGEDIWNPKTLNTENQEQTETDDNDTQAEQEETQTEQDDDTQADKEENQEQKAEKKAESSKRDEWISYIVLYFVILAVCWGIWQSVHIYYTAVQRDISAGKYSQAVRRVNRRIYRRLCLRGKNRQAHVTDTRYEQLLKDSFAHVSAEDWTRFMQAARAAAYAQDEISKTEAEFCWKIYCRLTKRKSKKQ